MYHDALSRSVRRAPLSVAGVVLLAMGLAAGLAAQDRLIARRVILKDVAPQESSTPEEGAFAGGAGLKTDPDLEQRMAKADELVKSGRFDLACVLWQKVLDESSGAVITKDDWTMKTFKRSYRRYRGVTGEIEQTIAALPPEALKTYRVTADGEAQGLLAGGTGDQLEEALTQITRRYFLSSQGDDAAFRLACLRMDRFDFVGASRLLTKVIDEYPDPSVPREELLLRLAVATARVGDHESAKSTLEKLKETGGVSDRIVKLVEADMAREGVDSVQLVAASENWPLAYGNSARTGHMKGLPAAATGKTLSELWTQDFGIGPAAGGGGLNRYPIHDEHEQAHQAAPPPAQAREQLLEAWKRGGLVPAGEVLLYQGLVYFKSSDRLICRDAHTGELVWMGRSNRYQMDPLSQIYAQYKQQNGQQFGEAEVMLFGDRVHQGMSIAGGVVYNIEGALADEATPNPPSGEVRERFPYGYGGNVGRTRRNFLCAYDAVNGKLVWHRSAAGEEESGGKFDVGFLAAPVPFARFLLLPVTDNGQIWVYGLDQRTGETVWKTFLCEDPQSGASPWSPVAVAVDGGDAYIGTGCGVVFAIDALSGSTRWAVRYERSGVASQGRDPRFGYGGPQAPAQLNGWQQDMVIPHGKNLVVMASDSDELFAVDRRTGEFLWESPRTPYSEVPPSEYCLGVVGDAMFAGGKNIVRRYDIPSGRLVWEARLSDSLGRGALTENAVYVPENDTIVRLDLEGGKRLSQAGVFSASKEPVGNLFTDGKRMLALGLGRMYALTDLSYRLDLLTERIKAGDVQSQLERMRLRLRDNDRKGALEDLRAAYQMLIARKQTEVAIATLCEGIDELALVTHSPRTTLQLVAQMPTKLVAIDSTTSDLPQPITGRRNDVLQSALRRIADEKVTGAAAEVLSIVPLCSEDHLLRAARGAMAATVTPADAARLKEALASPRVGVRTVAMAGIPVALGNEASGVLAGLLADSSDHIKLEAAWALGNAGRRESLAAFGQLLNSADLQVRVRSAQALRALTGQKIKYSAYEAADVRAAEAKEWQKWIAGDGQREELKFPIFEGANLLGRTLICYYSQNKVVEIDAEGRETWTKEVPYAWGCQGLPNGNRMVASFSGKFVTEYDSLGREVWKMTNLPGAPFSVQRLEDGNTLITCSDSQKVIEVDAEKKIVWEVSISGRPMDARRLDNGNTLVALQTLGKVVEVDLSGKVVWEIGNQGGVLAASRLENGNTLICRSGQNDVVEVNRAGETVWAQADLRNPYDAQRLPNGNTLIVDYQGVHEFDPKGKKLSEKAGNGASRVHRY